MVSKNILTAQQCRMARAGLGLSVRDLAEAAKVSTNTLVRLEAGEELKERTVEAVRAALEKAGVAFIAQNGGGAGVRLREPDNGEKSRASSSSTAADAEEAASATLDRVADKSATPMEKAGRKEKLLKGQSDLRAPKKPGGK